MFLLFTVSMPVSMSVFSVCVNTSHICMCQCMCLLCVLIHPHMHMSIPVVCVYFNMHTHACVNACFFCQHALHCTTAAGLNHIALYRGTHVCVYVYICICTNIYIYVYICICAYIYTYIYICDWEVVPKKVLSVCMYVYMYTHIHIHIFHVLMHVFYNRRLGGCSEQGAQDRSGDSHACQVAW
jgi:hypothetical protein